MVDDGTQANVARFDEIAATWDESPVRTGLARAVGQAVLEAAGPTGAEHALEVGCGTGLVTALVAPSVKRVVGADNSEGMLEVLRDKAQTLGLDNVEAVRVDIGHDVPRGPFDLIYSGMTMHHIADVAGLLGRLAGALAPGGLIAVADLESEDGTFHGEAEGIMHHGFDPAAVARWLTDAGLEGAATRRIHSVRKEGADGREHDYPVFMATARKPAHRP